MGRPRLVVDSNSHCDKIVKGKKKLLQCSTCKITKVNTRSNQYQMKVHVGKHIKGKDPCPRAKHQNKCFNKDDHHGKECHIPTESGYTSYFGKS